MSADLPHPPTDPPAPLEDLATSGIDGLDTVLAGGFIRNRMYLVEGSPGAGKTTLALQFLMEGVRRGEQCLHISMSETAAELQASATSHGWSLDGIELCELVPAESLLDADQQQSLLYSSDLELGETTRSLLARVEAMRPQRVVVDSLSEFRLLAQSSLRYRRQVLSLKHAFAASGATVLMLDDLTAEPDDRTAHSIAHGVLLLDQRAPEYGGDRRRLRVIKYRGCDCRGGFHDLTIETGGLRVFPRLVSAEQRGGYSPDRLTSGLPALDALFGGGLERGTSTILLGPSGVGKSVVALAFAATAVRRGERAIVYVFDEEVALLAARAKAMGFDLEPLLQAGTLVLEQVDVAETSPGAFAHRLRHRVESGVRTVVIDSLTGYQSAMPGESYLVLHVHELLQYLNRCGVATFMTVTQHGLVGEMSAPVDLTYLADTVVMLRYFEALGRVRRAISVLKKRAGQHENTVRELHFGTGGIEVGKPLVEFQGVLRGVPTFVGTGSDLMRASTA